MTKLQLPTLEKFKMPDVPFEVVDPSTLTPEQLTAFNEFMRGSTVPHSIYVYAHDYERFYMLVEQGKLILGK